MEETAHMMGTLGKTITQELLLTLIQAGFAILIMMTLKAYAETWAAYLTFRLSMNIGIGAQVRVPFETESIDGRIVNLNRIFITIESETEIIQIPTSTYRDRTQIILKRDSDSQGGFSKSIQRSPMVGSGILSK